MYNKTRMYRATSRNIVFNIEYVEGKPCCDVMTVRVHILGNGRIIYYVRV